MSSKSKLIWGVLSTTSLLALVGVASQAADRPITRESVIGRWSFDQTCASGNGMVLLRNGKGGVTETMYGTWRFEGRAVVFDVVDSDTDKRTSPRAQILSVSQTSLRLKFLPSGPVLNAKLCSRE